MPATASFFEGIRQDRTYGGYSKSLEHDGRKVVFRIMAESREELVELLPDAEKFWRGRVRWFKAFRDYAASELLDQLHENLDYGQDRPPKFTAAQIRRMLPAPFSIVLERVDDEEVYLEMSGGEDPLLQEHCFEVSGTLEEGITDGDVVALL